MNLVASLAGALLTLGWLAQSTDLRRRARALRVLRDSDEAVSLDHVFVVRPGVTLDTWTRRAASAHARSAQLQVLDLIPPHLSAARAGLLLESVDPARYRADRTAPGYTVGDALLVQRDVLARARLSLPEAGPHASEFVELAKILKRYAVTGFDVAVAPHLTASEPSLRERRAALRALRGVSPKITLAVQLALLAWILWQAPLFGLLALAVFQLQVPVVTWSSALSPAGLLAYSLARIPLDALGVFGPTSSDGRARHPSDDDLRTTYDALLAEGTARFFEPRRDDCPLCGAHILIELLASDDPLQRKPGRFVLSRCAACDHIFQNPRLSLAGLDFYYRDVYEGLGGKMFDDLFPTQAKDFQKRLSMVSAISKPSRWLDVGGGHGHFCCYASGELPETHFDALDLNEGIEEAQRRGWIRHGFRGLFPDLAPQLAANARYDVVSMSHYLEHALDPRAELAAAAKVLTEDGLLMIEVPDPESRIGRFFGSLWLPWLQPQHLHFVSAANLANLLHEHSFEPLVWHRGEAHMPHDFLFVTIFAIERLALPGDFPWRPRNGRARRTWRAVVWTLLAPAVCLAWLLDRVLTPLQRRAGWSNTYRVLARKRRESESARQELSSNRLVQHRLVAS
ncbi:MAG: class I SAM-dependent methyltransferase [Myxococcales bacterium]